MQKTDAVKFLRDKGMEAELSDGVVMVTICATGPAFQKQYRKLQKELKTAGYNSSFGARSCRKEA